MKELLNHSIEIIGCLLGNLIMVFLSTIIAFHHIAKLDFHIETIFLYWTMFTCFTLWEFNLKFLVKCGILD